MRYFTKEIYTISQKMHLFLRLHVTKPAEIFSEDYFKRSYEDELNKHIKKDKDLSELTADDLYPLDKEIKGPAYIINKGGVFSAKEYLSPEEFEKERQKMIEERKRDHDSYVSSIYDEEKIKDDFYRGYLQSLKRIREDYPYFILKDVADIRVLALNYISQANYAKIKNYCLECKNRVKQADEDYINYFNKINNKVPDYIVKNYGFHDSEVISSYWDGRDFLIKLNADTYSDCTGIRYINAEILENEGIDDCTWLYNEFIFVDGEIEYHSMLLKGIDELRYFTIRADNIEFSFNE
ncbi:MAG: DUF4085 family protein [Candidatus Metalachnospira sp.]|nr:DUF4085 family protein [Candidatus Metalachnospira sp.]